MSESKAQNNPAIRITLLPRDTNPYGTIFGGIILSLIDQAAAVATRRVTTHNVVTVSMHEVIFRKPVYVGDLVSFYADITKVGTTSIHTKVYVEAERRRNPSDVVHVTDAEVVFVAVDDDGNPVPVGGK
ncbi:MAG: acyl-CoA thioesterase [Candidatus Eisenbacteria bacterium]